MATGEIRINVGIVSNTINLMSINANGDYRISLSATKTPQSSGVLLKSGQCTYILKAFRGTMGYLLWQLDSLD